ncbi:MAG: von Willebrand factor type A domain-containing protein, partial [Candidatus Hydrogenedentota bacterium]
MDINRLARETGIYRFTITDINNAGASAARSPKDQVLALSEELVVRAYNAKNKEKARADVGGEAAAGISGGRGELVGGAVAQNPQPVPRGQIADDRDVIVFFQNAAPEIRENAPVETEVLFRFDQQGEQSPQSAGAYKRIGLEPMKGGNSSGSAGVQIQEGVVQQLGNYQTQVDMVTGKPLQTARVPGLQQSIAFYSDGSTGGTVTDVNGATPIREEFESLGYLGDPQGQQGITPARSGGTALSAEQAEQVRSIQESMRQNPQSFAMRSPAPGVHTSEPRPATAAVPKQQLESLGYISGDGVPIFGDVPAIGGGFGAGGFRVAGVPPQDRGFIAPSPPTITPGTEDYERIVESRFKKVSQAPLSTFSIDVDTASYSNMRRFITQGSMPPVDSVRIEELINYFDYDYPQPVGEDPFSSTIEVSTAPWNPQHKLVRVGLKGKEIAVEERPSTNLVFLLDVSGSMKSQNKLPLVKQSIRLLTEQLTENDRVAMVVYAGNSGLVLPSTPGNRQQDILGALNRLSAGGSTNGGAGIQLAYDVAAQNFIEGGVNRVILASDGDFNVGTTSRTALVEMIEQKAKSGVFLTVLGYGMGNLKDATMEQLANKGNGNYAYIDTFHEAKKVLSDELNATLFTIAKDVKIQV